MVNFPSSQNIIGPSFFCNCCDPTNRIMDWDDVVNLIPSDKVLKVNTEKPREKLQDGSRRACDYFKRQTPAIFPACQIIGKRLAENVVALTGIAKFNCDVGLGRRLFCLLDGFCAFCLFHLSSKNHLKIREKMSL